MINLTEDEMNNIIKGEIDAIKTKSKNTAYNNKWTPEIEQLRHLVIIREMGKGKSRIEICKYIQSKWGVNEKTANNYISYCYKEIQKLNEEDKPYYKDLLMNKVESLIADAIENKDRKTAMKGYEYLGKLAGVYEEKVNVKDEMTITFKFGDED